MDFSTDEANFLNGLYWNIEMPKSSHPSEESVLRHKSAILLIRMQQQSAAVCRAEREEWWNQS